MAREADDDVQEERAVVLDRLRVFGERSEGGLKNKAGAISDRFRLANFNAMELPSSSSPPSPPPMASSLQQVAKAPLHPEH